jgi:predicted RNase H-like nuclease
MDTYVGFDSAWTDNPKACGAICAICIKDGDPVRFHPPRLVSFCEARKFIQDVRCNDGHTLVALDQPTIVPNLNGMRPVERVAASPIGWMGGGVQPSNRGKQGMFCDAAPIWRFLRALGAVDDPEQARTASNGLYLMEVFPALALPSLDVGFFKPLRGAKYNPARKTFRLDHWIRVTDAAARTADSFGCDELAAWCRCAGKIAKPQKADQDELDAILCVLIALRWRLCPRDASLLLGDLEAGYMVLPVIPPVRGYLKKAAQKRAVAMDGVVPGSCPVRGLPIDATLSAMQTAQPVLDAGRVPA